MRLSAITTTEKLACIDELKRSWFLNGYIVLYGASHAAHMVQTLSAIEAEYAQKLHEEDGDELNAC